MDVLFRNGAYLFLGWMASPQQPARQGLWYSKVLSADGKAPGSFAVWHPLIYELNGVTWHDSGPATSASHQTGLFGATLEQDGQTAWLFYHGVRLEGSYPFASIGRARVDDLP